MDPSSTPDYLIVGQGMAGSLLGWELILRGADVVIVDPGGHNASRAAAGLINPVTGQRFVKSEHIETLLPVARKVYGELSSYFRQRFYFDKPMLRLFRDENEQRQCLRRINNPDYRFFLGKLHVTTRTFSPVEAPFGCLEQKQTGYLLTQPLLAALRDFFIARGSYLQQLLDYRDIRLRPRLKWRDFFPGRIIFCEGYQSMRNPWFGSLPMQPIKGEILTLKHSLPLPDKILNFGHWMIPLDSHRIRIGATFDRNYRSSGITGAGKSELLSAGELVIRGISRAEVLDHQAGIRPCTSDRQPFMGTHPRYSQLAIFNGFGARGSLLIPDLCRQFADFLLHQTPLPPHCSIQRYDNSYFAC